MYHILLIGGGPEPYHTFASQAPVLKRLLEGDHYQVTATDDRDMFLPNAIKNFDAILCFCTEGDLSNEQFSGLKNALADSETKRGVPFLAIHGATTCFNNQPEYSTIVGAKFLSHPEIGPEYAFSIADRDHPICRGMNDFSIRDEFYQMEYTASFNTLITGNLNNQVFPMAWYKKDHYGTVVYLSIGHDVEQLTHPTTQLFITNALQYLLSK